MNLIKESSSSLDSYMVDLDPPCRIHVLFTCMHKSAGVVKPPQLKWRSVWITKFRPFASHVGLWDEWVVSVAKASAI